jgi:hypothetical protein
VSNERSDLRVDVVALARAGERDSDVAARVLAALNARPTSAFLGSEGFRVTGLVWPSDPTQSYNDEGEPTFASGFATDVQATQAAWSSVSGSTFDFVWGGDSTRCPSLVRECPGPQVADGFNDVQWMDLNGARTVLGVTWSVASATPEADIALNLRFPWGGFGNASEIAYATILHESGHVVGLDHSADSGAVMHASMDADAPLQVLQPDDEEGVRYLYPELISEVTGTVTLNGNVVEGALVFLAGTDISAFTDGSGEFTLSGVPRDVTYDVVAVTGNGRGSPQGTVRVLVDEAIEDVGTLAISRPRGGGGGPF